MPAGRVQAKQSVIQSQLQEKTRAVVVEHGARGIEREHIRSKKMRHEVPRTDKRVLDNNSLVVKNKPEPRCGAVGKESQKDDEEREEGSRPGLGEPEKSLPARQIARFRGILFGALHHVDRHSGWNRLARVEAAIPIAAPQRLGVRLIINSQAVCRESVPGGEVLLQSTNPHRSEARMPIIATNPRPKARASFIVLLNFRPSAINGKK